MYHHWESEKEPEDRVSEYVRSVENDPLASLAEIRNVREDAEFLSDVEFCQKHGITI